MANSISISLQPRSAFGKKNKALRRSGQIPVHVYGQKEDPLSLQAESTELRTTLREAGSTTPVTVKIEGGKDTVTLVREVAVHPVSGDLLHVDFMRVNVSEEVEASVPIQLINEEDAPGTRGGAGVVTQGIYDITVSARPFDIPSSIEADCSILEDLDADIKASELSLPDGVTLVSDPDARVAWIQPPRVIEEDEVVGEEGVEGDEEGEGEEGEGGESEDGGGSDE